VEWATKKGQLEAAKLRISYANGNVGNFDSIVESMRKKVQGWKSQLEKACDTRNLFWISSTCDKTKVYTGEKTKIADTTNKMEEFQKLTSDELKNQEEFCIKWTEKVKRLQGEISTLDEEIKFIKKELGEKQKELCKSIQEEKKKKEMFYKGIHNDKLCGVEEDYKKAKNAHAEKQKKFDDFMDKYATKEKYAPEFIKMGEEMRGATVMMELALNAMKYAVEGVLTMAERKANSKLELKDALEANNLMIFEEPLRKEGLKYLEEVYCKDAKEFKELLLPLVTNVRSNDLVKKNLLNITQNALEISRVHSQTFIDQMPTLSIFFGKLHEEMEICGKLLEDNLRKPKAIQL